MKLDEIVGWYQKKIGTYDKQQWEKTIEQRILHGFTYMPLKDTKLKTELIDVDLVRGSSFPKAKPKQTLLTVLRLAVLRFLFLPVYARWWVEQTSLSTFAFLIAVYLLQMLNWAVYSYNVQRITPEIEHNVCISELLIPMALSLFLSVIHSQIVATASNTNKTGDKRKHLTHPKQKKRERIRRRKKNIRTRPTVESKYSDDKQKPVSSHITKKTSSRISSSSNNNTDDEELISHIRIPDKIVSESPSILKKQRNVNWGEFPTKSSVTKQSLNATAEDQIASTSATVKYTANEDDQIQEFYIELTKKLDAQTENQDEVVEQTESETVFGEDDGFESLNGKSGSSGEENLGLVVPNQSPVRMHLMAAHLKATKTTTTDSETDTVMRKPASVLFERKLSSFSDLEGRSNASPADKKHKFDSCDEDDEEDETDHESVGGTIGSPNSTFSQEATSASATEWNGITTNSEEYSSDAAVTGLDDEGTTDNGDFAPTFILNPSTGTNDRIQNSSSLTKVSCTIWDGREAKKAEMSVLDISTAIIEKVEEMPETCDYVYIGVALSVILSLVPAIGRLFEATVDPNNQTEINFLDLPVIVLEKAAFSTVTILRLAFGGGESWETTVFLIALVLRLCLTSVFFLLLAVAERTFKQKFLYAKLFSHLTSSRRAQKSGLPHFRLNKVRNIKTWLSVRSYLKKRGPQRSVDVIVSAVFMLTLLMLAFLSVEWLKESAHMHSHLNLEALVWSCAFGTFLLRFMTLGTKINRKYRSISVLITEQINLYLQIEQKPNKKEELIVANSVLKLAADLLKELESPFKISGLSANPYLYTTIKVVILSALSGVLSEMLGFKLKLHKIKIK